MRSTRRNRRSSRSRRFSGGANSNNVAISNAAVQAARNAEIAAKEAKFAVEQMAEKNINTSGTSGKTPPHMANIVDHPEFRKMYEECSATQLELNNVYANYEKLNARIEVIKEQRDNLSRKLTVKDDEMKSGLDDLKTQLDQGKRVIADLKTELGEVKTKLDKANKDLVRTDSELTRTKSELVAANKKMKTCKRW